MYHHQPNTYLGKKIGYCVVAKTVALGFHQGRHMFMCLRRYYLLSPNLTFLESMSRALTLQKLKFIDDITIRKFILEFVTFPS